MNDPSFASQAPPPRYLLESDSSDEEGQGSYRESTPSSSRPSHPSHHSSEVRIAWEADADQSVGEVVLGVGQAGRYLIRKLGKGKEKSAMRVNLGEAEVGKGWKVGETLVLMLDEAEGKEAWSTAQVLLRELQANNITILTSYVPSMYIRDSSAQQTSRTSHQRSAPIRRLGSTKSSDLSSWESPNFVTGLAGALASMAVHPACALPATAVETLFLPLPLSGIDTVSLASALRTSSPSLASDVERLQGESRSRVHWDEADDEPYSAAGMGGGKWAASHMGLGKEEVSSMYM